MLSFCLKVIQILFMINFNHDVSCINPKNVDLVTPLKSIGEACGYESCPNVEEGKINVHIVPHTHAELGRTRTYHEYYSGYNELYGDNTRISMKRILDATITQLWNDGRRKFAFADMPYFFNWWANRDGTVHRMVYELIRQGRLFFIGGGWSNSDESSTNYQTIIDHHTYSLRKINDSFLECGRPLVAWQSESIGHSKEFASLLAQMGYDGLFISPISYDDELRRMRDNEMEFLWRGSDDLGLETDIYTHKLFDGYWSPPGFCFSTACKDPLLITTDFVLSNIKERVAEFINTAKYRQAPYYRTKHIMIMMGMRLGYFDAEMWFANIDKLIDNVNEVSYRQNEGVVLYYSSPACYLKAVHDADPALGIYQDDFLPYAHDQNTFLTGMYTSRPSLKYLINVANVFLQMTKQLQITANLIDFSAMFEKYKWIMGVIQDHTLITGAHTESVNAYYKEKIYEVIAEATWAATLAFNYLRKSPPMFYYKCSLNESTCPHLNKEKAFMVIYNPLAWPVTVPVRIPISVGRRYIIYDPAGREVPASLMPIPEPVLFIPGRQTLATVELVFIAEDIPPLGYRSYYSEHAEPYISRHKRDLIKKTAWAPQKFITLVKRVEVSENDRQSKENLAEKINTELRRKIITKDKLDAPDFIQSDNITRYKHGTDNVDVEMIHDADDSEVKITHGDDDGGVKIIYGSDNEVKNIHGVGDSKVNILYGSRDKGVKNIHDNDETGVKSFHSVDDSQVKTIHGTDKRKVKTAANEIRVKKMSTHSVNKNADYFNSIIEDQIGTLSQVPSNDEGYFTDTMVAEGLTTTRSTNLQDDYALILAGNLTEEADLLNGSYKFFPKAPVPKRSFDSSSSEEEDEDEVTTTPEPDDTMDAELFIITDAPKKSPNSSTFNKVNTLWTSTRKPQDTSTVIPDRASTAVPQSTRTEMPYTTTTLMPHRTSTIIPHRTSTVMPHRTSTVMRHRTSTVMPHTTSTIMSHMTSTTMPHKTSTTMPHKTSTTMPHKTSTTMPHITSTLIQHEIKKLMQHKTSTELPQSTTLSTNASSAKNRHKIMFNALKHHNSSTETPNRTSTEMPFSTSTSLPREIRRTSTEAYSTLLTTEASRRQIPHKIMFQAINNPNPTTTDKATEPLEHASERIGEKIEATTKILTKHLQRPDEDDDDEGGLDHVIEDEEEPSTTSTTPVPTTTTEVAINDTDEPDRPIELDLPPRPEEDEENRAPEGYVRIHSVIDDVGDTDEYPPPRRKSFIVSFAVTPAPMVLVIPKGNISANATAANATAANMTATNVTSDDYYDEYIDDLEFNATGRNLTQREQELRMRIQKHREEFEKKLKEETRRKQEMEMKRLEGIRLQYDYNISLDDFIENEYLRVQLSRRTGKPVSVKLVNNITMNLDIQFYYYDSDEPKKLNRPDQRQPGAFVFRVLDPQPNLIKDHMRTRVYKNNIVQEVHSKVSDYASYVLRLYKNSVYLELDWVVGPIPIDDELGKEVFVRYTTDLVNQGVFYTDANGRQTVKRIRNRRSSYVPIKLDPIAGNIYPVTSKISIEDPEKNIRFSVFNDRSQGGTSLKDGQVDLFLHRRILTDDSGINAFLNETQDGVGIIVRGKHYLYMTRLNTKRNRIFEKKLQKEVSLPPQFFSSSPNPYNVNFKSAWFVWLGHNNEFSALKTKLPVGVHLLTLEPAGDNRILIRFENYLEKADVIRNGTKTVYLNKLFTSLKIKDIKETTLAANQLLKDWAPLQWRKERQFLKSFNEAYGNDNSQPRFADGNEYLKPAETLSVDDGINLKPQEIRTFICSYAYEPIKSLI